MSEGLVFCGKIIAMEPIPDADFIVATTVVCGAGGKWRSVVRKADFSLGDKCIVYLPDAQIPENDSMSFMEATHWRVKMRRYKGVPSEVVIMPYSPECRAEIGGDVTAHFGVTKYVKPIPASLAGIAKGDFPSFIPKTDEPNFQKSDELIAMLIGHPYYITEKADGSSTTAYKYKGEFGVCSRNLELIEESTNGYWEIANRYNLRENLPEGFALQWETCGPKIQKNPMGYKRAEGLAFSVYDINKRQYLDLSDYIDFCQRLKFPRVTLLVVKENYEHEDLNERARGMYPNGHPREGIVIRSQSPIKGKLISFKAINLDYNDN